MNTVTQLNKSKPAPQYNNEQVACILAFLAETTTTEPLSDNSVVGLSILLGSLSKSLLAAEA